MLFKRYVRTAVAPDWVAAENETACFLLGIGRLVALSMLATRLRLRMDVKIER